MRALITRPLDDAKSLAERLKQRGIVPVLAPLIAIAPRKADLPDMARAQALLFTSANGVRSFTKASLLRTCRVLTVGDATAEAARSSGFTQVSSASGDVSSLAAMAGRLLDPKAGTLYHVTGQTQAGDLAGDLTGRGFTVERLELYESHAAEALPPEVIEGFQQGSLELVLLYSPRTAEIFTKLVQEAGLAGTMAGVTALCLSKAVADAAPLTFSATRVAPKPEQESLLTLLPDPTKARPDGVKPEPPKPESPKPEGVKPEAAKPPASKPEEAKAAKPDTPKAPAVKPPEPAKPAPARTTDPEPVTPPAGRRSGAWVAGALGGVIGAGLVLGAGVLTRDLWLAELLPPPAPPRLDAIHARMDKLERDNSALLRTLENRTASGPSFADPTARLDALERDLTALRATPQAVAELPSDLRDRLDKLEQSVRGAADAATVASLAERTGRLTETVIRAEERIGKAEQGWEQNSAKAAQQAALAITAARLADAARIGQPFAATLASLRVLARDDATILALLDPLTGVAANGVAPTGAITLAFADAARKAKAADLAEGSDGWLAEIRRFLGNLVTIRRTALEDAGTSLDDRLAQAGQQLERGDLAGALAVLETLPKQAALAIEPWRQQARQRVELDRAVLSLTEKALSTLARSGM